MIFFYYYIIKQMNINIYEMKRKTEIENNLLKKINEDFSKYISEIQNIKKESTFSPSFFKNTDKYTDLNTLAQNNSVNTTLLIDKLFAHPAQTYWAFQYFYMKKKDFMGMNLTGLIDGKVETGLGFRNCLGKFFSNQIKSKHSDIYDKDDELDDNLIFYKIKSDTFKWANLNLPVSNNYFIIYNQSTKKYNILIEN